MKYATYLCGLISFVVVWLAVPWLIRYLKRLGMVVKDMHKQDKPLIPVSGGLGVMAGIFIGLMCFIFFRTFFVGVSSHELPLFIDLFAAITSILMVCFVGFIDDSIIKKNHDTSSGLKQWQKPLLTLVAAVPLMVVKAGTTIMLFPFLGRIDVGLLYPLLFVPIGVVGAANMVNLLGGFNGMEAGMGIIYTGMLGLYAYVNGSYIASVIAFITFCSLIAFYYYNKVPAQILAGDSLTYLLGAVIACIAILGDIERAALISSIPFVFEFFLKARGKFKKQSYGYYEDGKVHSLYDKIYSIPHFFTRTGKFTEKQVVYFMIIIQLIFSSLIW
ncbi:MAG: hypothetical protein KKG75_00465 [Nanoarchaeota archaeon]|nr:hypothetical protein [Nanoarchaeota archaeon]